MNNQATQRDSNIELLRIICIILIIIGHLANKYPQQGGILESNYLESYFIKSFTIVSVNVFILISGYFSISFKLSRILKMEQQVWFYSIFLLILMASLDRYILHLSDITFLCPIISKKYWFITIYVILYILSPILNKMALTISKNDFKSVLLIGFIIIYIWHTINSVLFTEKPIDDAGYGITNFIYLYLLGRYIKIYKNVLMKKQNYLLLYFAIGILLFIFQLTYSIILGFSFTALFSYNTIFVFLGSVTLFLFFTKLNIGYNVFINKWAKYCLAVYIIHEHPVFKNLIYDFLRITHISPIWFIPYILLISIVLYFTFALVEKIRLYFFDKIENKINSKIMQTKIAQKIENKIRLMDV